MEDTAILDLYFARNEAAIAQTAAKYGNGLYALSLRITENHEDTDECVSDTYFRAWNAIPPERPVHLFAYLGKIVRNLSLNICQKRQAQKRSAIVVELSNELQQCIAVPLAQPEDDALRSTLNSFLRSLDSQSRYIFVRRYFYSDALGDIAKATGRSENNLASVLFRIRKKLRNYLQKEGICL